MKKTMIMVVLLVLFAQFSLGDIELDGINFDPAIIAAGDEVDIVVQFHVKSESQNEDRIGNPDYEFKVKLSPDDSLTEDYVTIQDAKGDDIHGSLFHGESYNKRFRVKVDSDAPAGNYEFKLEGRWYKNGEPLEGTQFLRFRMPVKKEGIILDIATLETIPAEVRPGNNYVEISTFVENVGQKDAKSVEVNLELPDGLKHSYTNKNRLWIGRVDSGERKQAKFYVNVDEKADVRAYDLKYTLDYMDVDDNEHIKTRSAPFLVKPRPYLEIIESKGKGTAGRDAKMYVTVKNTGTESAESVDVRLLKQNSQPFTIDVRSDYIGELEPGEEGKAIFDLSVNSDADLKEHRFKMMLRSKGDSDEGDDNIYTYNRRAEFEVTGKAPNKLLIAGIIGASVIVTLLLINRIRRNKK